MIGADRTIGRATTTGRAAGADAIGEGTPAALAMRAIITTMRFI